MAPDPSEAAGAPATAYDAPGPGHSTDPAYDVRDFMVRAWSELLGRSDLTEYSDFFVRGGDSLLFSRLVRRVGQEFDVTVSPYDMSWRNLGDQVALVHSARARECREGAAGDRPATRCVTRS